MSVIPDCSRYVAWNVVKFKFDVVKLSTRNLQTPVKLFCSSKIKLNKTQVRIFIKNLPRSNLYFLCSRSPGVYLVFDVRGWGLFKAHITQVFILLINKSHKNKILSRILVVVCGNLSHDASSPCPLPYPCQVSHLVAETCFTTSPRLFTELDLSGCSSLYPLHWVTLFYEMTIFIKLNLVLILSRVCWKSPRLRENYPSRVSYKIQERQTLIDTLRLHQTLIQSPPPVTNLL